jgi:hypothetical protein
MHKASIIGLTDDEKKEVTAILMKCDPIFVREGVTANLHLITADNKPVVGAEVHATIIGAEKGQIVKTDANGMAIVNITGPSVVITAKRDGFNDYASTITVG